MILSTFQKGKKYNNFLQFTFQKTLLLPSRGPTDLTVSVKRVQVSSLNSGRIFFQKKLLRWTSIPEDEQPSQMQEKPVGYLPSKSPAKLPFPKNYYTVWGHQLTRKGDKYSKNQPYSVPRSSHSGFCFPLPAMTSLSSLDMDPRTCSRMGLHISPKPPHVTTFATARFSFWN